MSFFMMLTHIIHMLYAAVVIAFQWFIMFCNYIHLQDYIIPMSITGLLLTVIASITYGCLLSMRSWIRYNAKKVGLTQTHTILAQKISAVLIVALGSMIFVQTLGIQLAPLITLLGIIGVALGYALKDFIANLLAGILIITNKLFTINDVLETPAHSGVVKQISLSHTELEKDSKRIIIPNQILYFSSIIIHKK